MTMKTIELHENGDLTIKETFTDMVEGQEVTTYNTYHIAAHQVRTHLPMIEADLTAEQLEEILASV